VSSESEEECERDASGSFRKKRGIKQTQLKHQQLSVNARLVEPKGVSGVKGSHPLRCRRGQRDKKEKSEQTHTIERRGGSLGQNKKKNPNKKKKKTEFDSG